MKERKFKPCLTKQLLNMFKLRCEWGFILYFIVMQQTISFQLVSQQISTRVARKMPNVPKPMSEIKCEFPPLQLRGIFFNDNTDNLVEGKFTSTRIKKDARKPFWTGNGLLADLVSHIFGIPPLRKKPVTELP